MAYQKVFRSVMKNRAHGNEGANWNPSFGVGLHLDTEHKNPPVIEFMLLPDSRIRGTSGQNLINQLSEKFYRQPTTSGSPLIEKARKLYKSQPHNEKALSKVEPIRTAFEKASTAPFIASHANTVRGGLQEFNDGRASGKSLDEASMAQQGTEVLLGSTVIGIGHLLNGEITKKESIQALIALGTWAKSIADQAKASPDGPAAFVDQYLESRRQDLIETVQSSRAGARETYEELVDVFEHHAYLSEGLENARVMVVEPSAIYYDKTKQLIHQASPAELEKQGVPVDVRIFERTDNGYQPVQSLSFVDDINGGALEAQKAGFQVGVSELYKYRNLFHSDPENQAEYVSKTPNADIDGDAIDEEMDLGPGLG